MSALTFDALVSLIRALPKAAPSVLVVPSGYRRILQPLNSINPFALRVIESPWLPRVESDAKRRRYVRWWIREAGLARKLAIRQPILKTRAQDRCYLIQSEPTR